MNKNLSVPRAGFSALMAFLSVLISLPGWAEVSVRGEPLQASELQVLPPVCKLIVVDIPNAHLGAGNGPLTQYAPLFEEPRYQMAKNNIHFHHYCWALVSKQRYFRERDKNKRNYYLSQFMGDIDYVLQHSDQSWPYFDVMLVEQGQMQAIVGNYAAAISKANDALRHQPNSEIAYMLKSDSYKNMGNKTAAITAAKEGLEKNPESTRLRKRLTGLGQTVPPLAERKPAPVESSKEPSRSEAPSAATPVSTAPVSDTAASDKPAPAPEAIGTKNNPYCRFCP